MIRVVLTPEEARAAHARTLTEIRRPVEGLPPDPQNVRYLHRAYLKCDAPAESGTVSLRIPCPWGDPHPDERDHSDHLLFIAEAWRSWIEEGEEEDEDGRGSTYWRQTYVAYEATPRRGYRPEPDRAAITFLDDSSPLSQNPRLLGPWEAAETMPLWASRFAFRNVGVRVEQVAGVWTWIGNVERVERDGKPVRPAEMERGR